MPAATTHPSQPRRPGRAAGGGVLEVDGGEGVSADVVADGALVASADESVGAAAAAGAAGGGKPGIRSSSSVASTTTSSSPPPPADAATPAGVGGGTSP